MTDVVVINQVEIVTPSRLHFGLFGWGEALSRQFGGVGLMIDSPGIGLIARPASTWQATGPHAARVLEIAQRVASKLGGETASPAVFQVSTAPPEHVGLGVGTQLSLAVTQALWSLRGGRRLDPLQLAELSGRGQRSGIGLHGFAHGGLIVDGGKKQPSQAPPLIAHAMPSPSWRVLLVVPRVGPGPHGEREADAFRRLPPVTHRVVDRLCALVLLGILPAVVERDLPAFGAALTELQDQVGLMFAAAQGGRLLGHALLEEIVHDLRAMGFHGVGQSSWGPTIYGFTDLEPDHFRDALQAMTARLGLEPTALSWTRPSETGAQCDVS